MKKILIALAVCTATAVNAQTAAYTDSSLQVMNKGQLVDIYITQVNQLIEKLPYTVWGLMAQETKLDVPNSKYIGRKRKGVSHDASNYKDTNSDLMYEVVYYADKPALINAVLYLQLLNTNIINVR